MNALKVIKALGPVDALSVRRDSMLRWVVALPVLIALLARWFLPVAMARLGQSLRVDLAGLYPVVTGYALLVTAPVMSGTVIGFLLLDERDEGTLTALRVTPLPLGLFLAYRLTLPTLLSVLVTLVIFPVAGLAGLGLPGLLAAALAAAPLAPLMALALAAFAENKVQGFALVKASGVFQAAPLVAYFVGSGWQPAFGLVPTYWPAKLLWALQAGEAHAWVYLLVGLAYQLSLLVVLLRLFNRNVAR